MEVPVSISLVPSFDEPPQPEPEPAPEPVVPEPEMAAVGAANEEPPPVDQLGLF